MTTTAMLSTLFLIAAPIRLFKQHCLLKIRFRAVQFLEWDIELSFSIPTTNLKLTLICLFLVILLSVRRECALKVLAENIKIWMVLDFRLFTCLIFELSEIFLSGNFSESEWFCLKMSIVNEKCVEFRYQILVALPY